MKATLTGGDLSRAASWALRMTPRQAAMPVLSGIVLDAAESGTVTFSAFDYDVSGRVTVQAGVGEPGRVLLSGRLLSEVGKAAAKAPDVTVATDGAWATVTAGRSEWSLPLMDVDTYPQLPAVDDPDGTVDAEVLVHALGRVLPAVQKDVGTPPYGGVHFSSEGGTLTIATTDRFRLAVADVPWQPAGDTAVDMAVAYPALEDAVAALKDAAGPVALSASGNRFSLATATHSVTSAALSEPFVNWRKILPTAEAQAGPALTLPAGEFCDAVAQALIMVADKEPLTVHIGDGEVTFRAGQDQGKATSFCPCDNQTGEPYDFTANPQFLRDMATGMDAPKFRLFCSESPKRPILALPLDGDGETASSYQHLLMPLRVQAGSE